MNGIEILSQSEVVAELAYNWIAFSLALIIMSAISIVLGLILGKQEKSDYFIVAVEISLIIFVGLLLSFLAGAIFSTPVEYKTQYKVTIDETVSMAEFYERYEIIEQESKIFTIEEKSTVN